MKVSMMPPKAVRPMVQRKTGSEFPNAGFEPESKARDADEPITVGKDIGDVTPVRRNAENDKARGVMAKAAVLLAVAVAPFLVPHGGGEGKAPHRYMEDTFRGGLDPDLEIRMSEPAAGPVVQGTGTESTAPSQAAAEAVARTDASGQTQSALDYVLPAGWTREPGQGMRIATLKIGSTGLDCSIIGLDGPAGGVEANVARWLGQLGASADGPAVEKALGTAARRKTATGATVWLFDLRNDNSAMLAILVAAPARTYFLKTQLEASAVSAVKPAFEKLYRSVELK